MLFENVNKILMIQKITIEGYKSIKEQTVELFPINILIGGNGIGKSNFISAFTLIHNLYERNLQNYVLTKGGSDSLLYMGKKETDHLSFDLFFAERGKDAHNRFIVNMKEAQDSLFIERIDTAYHNGVSWHKQLHEVNKQESSFKNDHTGQAFYVNSFLREFEVYHFHDTGDRSPMKGKCNMDDNVSLKNNGANIAAFLYYLKEKHPGETIYVVGTPSLINEFKTFNMPLVDENPDIVILGFDTTLTYEKISKACHYIRNGCTYYGINPDWNCPMEGGTFIPDCGSMAKLVEASTGRFPEFFGKPSKHTLDYIIKETGYKPEEIAIVGDRLYTDIAVADGSDVTSILVLSGESTLEDVEASDVKPDIILESLKDITEKL